MKAWKHFKKVMIHKYWVLHYARIANITWKGLKHDISKLSPTEFFESVKYYQGDRSPIDACKEENGYSLAWFHHKGRNPHHYEYWQDNFDNGGHPVQIPYEYAVEMVCDYLAAGRAYMGKDFSYQAEYSWWKNKISKPIAMHPQTVLFLEDVFSSLAETDNEMHLFDASLYKKYCRAEVNYIKDKENSL